MSTMTMENPQIQVVLDPSHEVWLKDFNNLADAIKPWVVEANDGFQYVSPDAPEDLMRPYKALMNLGYIKGWL